jgi:hypothetical protein
MQILRNYVRRIIKEIYELDEEEIGIKQALDNNYGAHGPIYRRTRGIQTPDEQRSDRRYLDNYQWMLQRTKSGKEIIRACRTGSVSILHSIAYHGAASNMGWGGTDGDDLVSDWIKKYGRRGKDSLSTVLFNTPPDQSIKTPRKTQDNNWSPVIHKRGVLLKGYPVFVSQDDAMTQTLGALSQKHKDHQSPSGIAKRPYTGNITGIPATSISSLGSLKDGVANEVILDNWEVIGTYIQYFVIKDNTEPMVRFVQDSLSLGLPCNIYGGTELLARIENESQLEVFF